MLTRNSIIGWKSALVICIILANFAAARIRYVDADATGAEPGGSSWSDAYNRLERALDAARPGDEIWVAQGVYTPSKTGDREESFILKEGVKIKGGYAGLGEPR